MKMTIYYSNGVIDETQNVIDKRKVWRRTSKFCKWCSKAYGEKVRVTKVIKEG